MAPPLEWVWKLWLGHELNLIFFLPDANLKRICWREICYRGKIFTICIYLATYLMWCHVQLILECQSTKSYSLQEKRVLHRTGWPREDAALCTVSAFLHANSFHVHMWAYDLQTSGSSLKNHTLSFWRDRSAVKSTDCSFNSQGFQASGPIPSTYRAAHSHL